MIPVLIEQLFLSNMGYVVLLGNRDDERSLPIFIGGAEAQAIALEVGKVKPPRPMTHDLLKNVLDFLECRLKRVEVCDLREGTFFARLVLERDGREMIMDSRPSDAIALALRCAAPMFVDPKVMDQAGRVFTEAETKPDATGESAKPAPKKKDASEMTPAELLERQLEAAVKEERYEDAARLRDEIQKLKQHRN
jgi:bifunctional DNase/RNase